MSPRLDALSLGLPYAKKIYPNHIILSHSQLRDSY